MVVIERKGRRLVLRREPRKRHRPEEATVSYEGLLDVPDLDDADRWGWEWTGPGADLTARDTMDE